MENKKLIEVIENVEQVIYGKTHIIELILTSMLAGGHVLLEDVPGVGKTKLVEALARSMDAEFNRLQMTPDIMPSDIIGFSMIDLKTKELSFKKGAVFCNFLLADEINRSSPKSQAALLEVMEENKVSMDNITYELPKPFIVLATQNPVETYGTYHLPEAQMDRFLMKLNIGYPVVEDEINILKNSAITNVKDLKKVVSMTELEELKKAAEEVFVSNAAIKYIVDIAWASRKTEEIKLGISPRGSLGLYKAAQAYEFLKGGKFVTPDTIKFLAPYVLSHRIILSPQGRAKWKNEENAIKELVSSVAVPV